jgi:hypothetical protein
MSYTSKYEKKKKTMAEFSSEITVNICQIAQDDVPQHGYLPAIKCLSSLVTTCNKTNLELKQENYDNRLCLLIAPGGRGGFPIAG